MRDPRSTSNAAPKEPLDDLLRRAGIDVPAYRPGTSDERVLREVLFTTPYRRKRMNFDVERGEHWLDLGANIGAFALYCKMRGATADCYEPDTSSFELLDTNIGDVPGFHCFNAAVTTKYDTVLPFWVSRDANDHQRGTTFPMKVAPLRGQVKNIHAQYVVAHPHVRPTFDGCKMDIEGTEGELLDGHWIPQCKKLVVEYHLWRDDSMINLRRRLEFLKSRFSVVQYPPEFDRMLASGFEHNTSYYDRLIFCKSER